MYSMPCNSFWHGVVSANLGAELVMRLRESRCITTICNIRVLIAADRFYTYPDVMTVSGSAVADNQNDTILNPALIAEVFSPSTEMQDRGFKFARYRLIPSLQEYVLVSQTEPRVEVFRRHSTDTWIMSEFTGLEETCRLRSMNCEIPLAEIYHKVEFQEQPNHR